MAKYRTIQPPKVGDTISVYGYAARIVKILPAGAVRAVTATGRHYVASGFITSPLVVPA